MTVNLELGSSCKVSHGCMLTVIVNIGIFDNISCQCQSLRYTFRCAERREVSHDRIDASDRITLVSNISLGIMRSTGFEEVDLALP